MTLQIPDLSQYQDDVDWSALAGYLRSNSGGAAAIVKVSEGTYLVDPKADRNIDAGRASSDLMGFYAYFKPDEDPAAQADVLVRVLQAHGGLRSNEFVVCDCEEGGGDLSGAVNAFLDRCRQQLGAGDGQLWWYSSVDFAQAHLPSAHGNRWIAAYGQAEPTYPHDLWQFTDSGRLPGIAGAVDISLYHGSIGDLRALIGGGSTGWNGTYPMPDPPPAGTTVDVIYTGRIMPVDGAGNPPHWFAEPDGADEGPAPVGAVVTVSRAAYDGVNWFDQIAPGVWWLLDSAIDGTDANHPNGQTPVTAWNEAHRPKASNPA